MWSYKTWQYYDYRANMHKHGCIVQWRDSTVFTEVDFVTQQEAECYAFDYICMISPHSCVMVNMDLI